MSEPQEDVLHKLDALLKKHAPTEREIPVLTDVVEQPRVDLDSIPVLTEEIPLDLTPNYLYEQASGAMPESDLQALEHDDAHVGMPGFHTQDDSETPSSIMEHNEVLARLEEVEHEVEAEIKARIARVQKESTPLVSSGMEAPKVEAPSILPTADNATSLAPTPLPSPVVSAEKMPEEMLREITARLETDIARIVQNNVQQTLADALPQLLNSAMDKALSSLIEQFMMHMEEVVRQTIADELKKQLAPFKRPSPGNKP